MAIGTPVFEGHTIDSTDNTSNSVSSITTNTDDLIIAVWCGLEDGTSHSCSDDASNTYATDFSDIDHASTSMELHVFGSPGSTALSTQAVQVSWTTNVLQDTLSVISCSGIATSSPVDQTNSGEFNGTTTPGSIGVTTTVADTLLIGIATNNNPNRGVSSWGAGWTSLSVDDTGTNGISVAYRIESSTGTYSLAPTMKLTTAGYTAIVAYKASGAGGGLSLPIAHYYRSQD